MAKGDASKPSLPPPSFPSSEAQTIRARALPSLCENDEGTSTSQTAIRIPPAGTAKRAVVTVLSGLNAGQVCMIGTEFVIGRSHDCDLQLRDQGISRRHTRIFNAADWYALEDLGSTNGTYVNGARVRSAKLGPGDRVQVGLDVVFAFTYIDQTEEALAKKLYEASTRDGLTGAFSRKYFSERCNAELSYAGRHPNSALSVIMFDIDHFKRVNDTQGHLAGDRVLRAVAARATQEVRLEDVVARYGGEEFIILVREDSTHAFSLAERLRRGIEGVEVPHERGVIRVTVSVGVASLDEVGRSPSMESLVGLADERLYRAKRAGRNRTQGRA
jgi:diguanylate cyclase (GGDEF)-like protein